jgi:hypothetical protein
MAMAPAMAVAHKVFVNFFIIYLSSFVIVCKLFCKQFSHNISVHQQRECPLMKSTVSRHNKPADKKMLYQTVPQVPG